MLFLPLTAACKMQYHNKPYKNLWLFNWLLHDAKRTFKYLKRVYNKTTTGRSKRDIKQNPLITQH